MSGVASRSPDPSAGHDGGESVHRSSWPGSDEQVSVMAGLVPAIHVLNQAMKQILPIRIVSMDQPHFPRTWPVFDRLLTLNRGANIFMPFKIDELFQPILLREATQQTVAMLVTAPDKIAGDADIKRAVTSVGHYVNKTAFHPRSERRGCPRHRRAKARRPSDGYARA